MKSISVDTLEDKFVVSIDKKMINKDQLLQFVDNLSVEFLAKGAAFDDEIEIIGDTTDQDFEHLNNEFIDLEIIQIPKN